MESTSNLSSPMNRGRESILWRGHTKPDPWSKATGPCKVQCAILRHRSRYGFLHPLLIADRDDLILGPAGHLAPPGPAHPPPRSPARILDGEPGFARGTARRGIAFAVDDHAARDLWA